MIGLILIILEIVQYKTFIRELQFEITGLVIGILFLGLGIWFGIRFFNQKEALKGYKAEDLGLSKREIEVLELLAQGLSNQEIADKLFVSLNTAKTHISSIYSKLGVSRRTQAVEKARKLSIPIQSSDDPNHPKE